MHKIYEAALDYVERFADLNDEPADGDCRNTIIALRHLLDTEKPLGPIVVAMEGGLVSSVVSTDKRLHGIDVVIVDYDIEGADESELRKVVQHDGESAEALIGEDRIGEATINIDYLLASTEEDYAKIARANGWAFGKSGVWFDDTGEEDAKTFATAKEVCKYEELI